MKKTGPEKYRKQMREDFPRLLDEAFKEKFAVKLNTEYNILSMALISTRDDEKKLTPKQRDWIEAWCAGYGKAAHALAVA